MRVIRSQSPVSVALFDLDNTLIDRQAAFRRWSSSWVDGLGLDEKDADWLCQIDNDGFADRGSVFGQAKRRFGLQESVHELLDGYRASYPDFFAPNAVLNDHLRELRRAGWSIGVVTNGPSTQREKMARAGLTNLVDVLCISDELGFAKPDVRIFEHALRCCDVDLAAPGQGSRTWMVGDTPVPDIGGGAAAGLQTVWIRRERTWLTPEFHPDVIVTDILEAVTCLLAGEPRPPDAERGRVMSS
jgi:FMN phosphatase YigB (HAD superfamily)